MEHGPRSDLKSHDINCEGMLLDKNCDQIRNSIRLFLDGGEFGVGEFCRAIRVSNKSLNSFLRQHGPTKGTASATYTSAWEFFKKREIIGWPAQSNKKGNGRPRFGKAKAEGFDDIDSSNVHLSGEEHDDIRVYDTCDEVRRKVSAYLKRTGATRAQFCRILHAQFNSRSAPASIQSSQLSRFRNSKGPNTGNTSSVFYAAYGFFEKLRIKAGRPKSRQRMEMERIWPNGVDRKRIHNHRDVRLLLC